jgi:hypothetical protein
VSSVSSNHNILSSSHSPVSSSLQSRLTTFAFLRYPLAIELNRFHSPYHLSFEPINKPHQSTWSSTHTPSLLSQLSLLPPRPTLLLAATVVSLAALSAWDLVALAHSAPQLAWEPAQAPVGMPMPVLEPQWMDPLQVVQVCLDWAIFSLDSVLGPR